MPTPPHPSAPDPDDDAGDPVWSLLKRSREVTPSPHFARRVLAAVHAEQAARHTRWRWLHHLFSPSLRPAVALAALALLVAGGWFLRSFSQPHGDYADRPSPRPATAEPTDDDSEALVQAIATELALLDDVDHLLDPQDGLDLVEDDVERLLF